MKFHLQSELLELSPFKIEILSFFPVKHWKNAFKTVHKHLLEQVGGLANENVPSAWHSVVVALLVVYPSRHVYTYVSWYCKRSAGVMVLTPSSGTPHDFSKNTKQLFKKC